MGNDYSLNATQGSFSIEYWFKETTGEKRPIRVDLRRFHCFPYPIPKDQGSEGSCVTHAMSTAFICAQRRANINVVDSKIPVVKNLFEDARKSSNVSRSVSKGITFSEAMKPIQKDAMWFRIGRSLENFKHSLAVGYPIVMGFAVTKRMRQWQDSPTKIRDSEYVLPSYDSSIDTIHGYHCVLLVGYDDEFRGGNFIARNSWGEKWGWGGHFFYPYHLVNNNEISLDAMVLDLKK